MLSERLQTLIAPFFPDLLTSVVKYVTFMEYACQPVIMDDSLIHQCDHGIDIDWHHAGLLQQFIHQYDTLRLEQLLPDIIL